MSIFNSKIKDILVPLQRDVETLADDNTSVEQVIKLLTTKKLTALPLMRDGKLEGFVDYVDILNALDISPKKRPHIELHEPVKKFVRAANHEIHTLSPDSTLEDAMKLFAQGQHRIPIVRHHELINLFTQSDALRFIWNNKEQFAELLGKKIEALKLTEQDKKHLSQIDDDQPLFKAFDRMKKRNLTSIATVDQQGKLSGCFSVSDLRLLVEKGEKFGNKKISQVLEPRQNRAVSVPDSASFGELVDTLVIGHLHRVWIVSTESIISGVPIPVGSPAGVASLTDVLKLFYESK